MSVYVYTRISTKKTGKHDLSLPMQKYAIDNYCKTNNLFIVKYFTEMVSAGNMYNLHKLMRLLKSCRKNDIIMFANVSRFSRNYTQAVYILDKLTKNGVQFYSVDLQSLILR